MTDHHSQRRTTASLHRHASLRRLLARASLDEDDEIVVDGVIDIGDHIVALGRVDSARAAD